MRTILTIFLVAATALMANAQTQLHTIHVGDTVELRVTGHHGTIQWQQSTDSLAWTDMIGFTDSVAVFLATTSPTNKKFYRAKITDALCPNATPVYSSIIRQRLITSTTQILIGDWFRGGIVFYTDGTGHGLIAPQTNQSDSVQWGCNGTSIPGATSLTDGNTNTTAIYNNCATRPIAASVCYDLALNCYNDWFLPAKDQLNYLYQQRALVGGFSSNEYWSSSEYIAGKAWDQHFPYGWQYYDNKFVGFYVRCVRSFSPADDITLTTSYATVNNQPVTANISIQPQTQNKCLGSSVTFSITATGTASISYQWKKDGVDISGETSNTYTKSVLTLADEGIYTCEVTNLCRTIASNNAELKVIQLSTDAGTDTGICNGQGTVISASAGSNHPAESGNYSYSWSPTAGLSASIIYNPNASPISTTNYTVQITDQIGCTITDVVNVLVQNVFQNEEICLVTVDTVTWKNKVMWEKTAGVGTEYYIVYKETGVNSYAQIGNTTYSQPSEFVDLFSVPEVHGDKYKISVLDTCGNESGLSYFHKTMNLTIAAFGSTMGLNWDDYIDESGNYVPIRYYIYRGTSPTTMALHDSVSGSFNSYNDINVFNVYYYVIGVKKNPPCNVIGSIYSYSNRKDNSTLVGINTQTYSIINVSPNPAHGQINIKTICKEFTVEIIDIVGQVLIKENSKKTIDIQTLPAGTYFVKVKTDECEYQQKIIVY